MTATSGLAPTALAIRAVLPLAGALLSITWLRDVGTRRLVGLRFTAASGVPNRGGSEHRPVGRRSSPVGRGQR